MSDLHPLASAVSHPSPLRGTLPRWRVLVGLLLSPAAYAMQVVVSYAIAARTCSGTTGSNILLALVNLAALAAIAFGLFTAIGNYRRTREESAGNHKDTQDIGAGRSRFLAYCALCSSTIFGLAVIVQLTSILVLHRCLGLPVLP